MATRSPTLRVANLGVKSCNCLNKFYRRQCGHGVDPAQIAGANRRPPSRAVCLLNSKRRNGVPQSSNRPSSPRSALAARGAIGV
ncbi:hypothetical protein PLANPX_5123 [Lacipirellula parvula]|uniref:Uncharacterized protein n=1 Tax=Lacipirellula parvula TaxID=2650471 RepID=A0A5K7XK57_9BACT|nr:hypothetical protein PLANPX_5123 [Lacipirellula parvula]